MAIRMVVIPEKVYEYLTTRVSDSAYSNNPEVDEPSPTVRRKRHRDTDAFTCATCERQLSSRRRLREHSLIHEAYESRPYVCVMCLKRYVSSSNLAMHQKYCRR